MKYYQDYSVKLITDTKHSGLYKWCLQEFNNNGKQIERDLIPHPYRLYFEVVNLCHINKLDIEDTKYDFIKDVPKAETRNKNEGNFKVNSSSFIYADLIPDENEDERRPSYSMIGSNREIRNISLKIEKGEKTTCSAWGNIKTTWDMDWRSRTDDDLFQFLIVLSSLQYNELIRKIDNGISDKAWLSVGSVNGFYSDWSPDFSTDYIKVLTNFKKEVKIDTPTGNDINPVRLGWVGEFSLNLEKKIILKTKKLSEENSKNYKWAEEQTEVCLKNYCLNKVDTDSNSKKSKSSPRSYTFNEDLAKKLRQTERYRITNEVYLKAANYAEENNLTTDEIEELSGKINSFLFDLADLFPNKENKSNKKDNDHKEKNDDIIGKWRLWKYPEINFQSIMKGDKPEFNFTFISQNISDYLDLPIRHKEIDRMLVDSLISWEIIEFAHQMLRTPLVWKEFSISPFGKSHPLWQFIKTQATTFLILVIAPIFLLFVAVTQLELKESWALIIGIIFSGIWALILLQGIFALPADWISNAKQKNRVSELLSSMEIVRKEIKNDSVVSARHIRERLYKTTEKGAIWPSEVFVLLDDIIKRNGTL